MALVANEDWLRLLADAGRILGASLDAESTLQEIAGLAVPRLGDWCAVALVEGNGQARLAAQASGSERERGLLERLLEKYPFRPDSPYGLAKVMRSGQPELVPEIPPGAFAAIARDEEHLSLLAALDLRSMLIVPLVARGRTLGAAAFGLAGGLRRYGEGDKAWACELALRIALSVDNARLYRETLGQAEALRERESHYRALTENVPVLVWMTDPQGRPLFFNRQCSEYSGVALGRDFPGLAALIHPDDRQAILDARRDYVGKEQPYRLAFRLRRADGEYRWHVSRSVPVRDAQGALEAWFGSAVEVHELREAEARLTRSEGDLRALFEYSGVGLGQADPDTGRIVGANRKLCEITGYSSEELLGMTISQITHPDDREREGILLRRVIEEGRDYWVTEKRYVRKDGSVRWVQVHGTRLPAAGDRPARLAASVHDITERKLAEQAARQAREKLLQSQRVEAIGRLAGGIAHDFNNLLTAINGYADLLLTRFEGDRQAREYLAEIRQAGEKAATLTQQMLAYGRRQMLDPRLVDVSAVARRLGQMLARMLDGSIRVEAEAPEPVGPVLVDPAKLDQALVHLALNARDAMPGGGVLTLSAVRLRLAVHAEGYDAIVPPGEYAVLSMEDTGEGMDPAVQARMFEPFFTTKGVGEGPSGRTGSGLGLSMVLGVVKQSGGFIRVDTAPGKGTRFRILLPLSQAEEPSPHESPDTAGPGAFKGAGTVLVVEDEDSVRRYACALLSKAGYTVLDSRDGESALALLKGHSGDIHLLLTDVVMPGMLGTRLAEEARRLRPGLETVFMTGYSDQSVVEYGILPASDTLLKKPFTARMLLESVRAVLEPPPSSRPAKATAKATLPPP